MDLVCPFCYVKFREKEILHRCENPNDQSCPKENDDDLARYFGAGSFNAKHIVQSSHKGKSLFSSIVSSVFSKQANKLACDVCHRPTSKKICPGCHNQIPTYFYQAESHIISVVGARSSGKTHYITILLNELKRKGNKVGLRMYSQDVGEHRQQVTSIRYKNVYKRPLIDELTELPQTQENAKDLYPLIYEICSDKYGNAKRKVIYLVFYDTAGENFKDEYELKKVANYISNSSGVIFLIDTFQIPAVHSYLKKNGLNIPQTQTGFTDVLDRIKSLFEQEGHIDRAGGATSIPVAVTLSKFDEVLNNNLMSTIQRRNRRDQQDHQIQFVK